MAGESESVPKTPRRRRKAVTADQKDEQGEAQKEANEPVSPAEPVPPPSEAAVPVKVTRTRRKKAVPAAAEVPVEPTADLEHHGYRRSDRAGGNGDAGRDRALGGWSCGDCGADPPTAAPIPPTAAPIPPTAALTGVRMTSCRRRRPRAVGDGRF